MPIHVENWGRVTTASYRQPDPQSISTVVLTARPSRRGCESSLCTSVLFVQASQAAAAAAYGFCGLRDRLELARLTAVATSSRTQLRRRVH
jgi:hypothetical protein